MELNFSVSSGNFLNSCSYQLSPQSESKRSLPLVCSASFFLPTMFSFWFSTSSRAVESNDFCSSERLISGGQLLVFKRLIGLPFHVDSAAEKFCSAMMV